MYEMYKIEDVIKSLKIKLKDFLFFKKYVRYSSKLDTIISTFILLGFLLITFNILYTIDAVLKQHLPFKYFFDVFFATDGDIINLILTILSILGFIFWILASFLKIFNILKKDANYRKIYHEFLSTATINKKRAVLISNSCYLLFKDESDAEKMLTLLASGTFDNDKNYKKIINHPKFQSSYSYLSNHLKKIYEFNDVIETVFHRFSKNNNTIQCKSGTFQLFVVASCLHLIKVDTIIKDTF